MLSKARIGSLAAATTVLASLAAYGAPAQAASVAITFATATPGGTDRTLNVFNSDGNVRRAIDIHEGDEIDASAFKDLIRAAVALNLSGKKKK